MYLQPKLSQTPDPTHRPSQALPTFSLRQITSQCHRYPPWSICIIHLFSRPHTHPHPPTQPSRTLLCHPHRSTLSRLLYSEPTTLNSKSLPLGKISAILALHRRNIFLQRNVPGIPTLPSPLVHLTTRTSHPSSSSSMIFATDRPRLMPCRRSPLGGSGFFLRCLSYGVKEGSGQLAKERKLLEPDPHLSMASIRLMSHDRHSYHNSSKYMNISSTTI
jgi:hypothetical protein